MTYFSQAHGIWNSLFPLFANSSLNNVCAIMAKLKFNYRHPLLVHCLFNYTMNNSKCSFKKNAWKDLCFFYLIMYHLDCTVVYYKYSMLMLFFQYYSKIILNGGILWFTFYSNISMLQFIIMQWTMACVINVYVLIHHLLVRHWIIRLISSWLINRIYIIGCSNHCWFPYLIHLILFIYGINRLIF